MHCFTKLTFTKFYKAFMEYWITNGLISNLFPNQYDPNSISIYLLKGQLNSEWSYEVIVSPKMPTKNLKDFCTRSLLEGRAEILQIFGWHFGRNDDLINSFWIYRTFSWGWIPCVFMRKKRVKSKHQFKMTKICSETKTTKHHETQILSCS